MRLAEDTKIEDIRVGCHKKPNFLTVIPTLGMVPIEFVTAFGRLQMPVNALSGSLIVKGMEVGYARDYAVREALNLENRPEYIFFLGDDMLPPWDGLVSLHKAMETQEWDIVSGLYYWKGDPPTPLTWRKSQVGPLLPGVHFELGEIVDVDVTGMDFTLIKLSSLERMKVFHGGGDEFRWFRSGPDLLKMKDSNGEWIQKVTQFTEDVWFCDLAKEAGLRIGVHSGVRVAHLDVKTGAIW